MYRENIVKSTQLDLVNLHSTIALIVFTQCIYICMSLTLSLSLVILFLYVYICVDLTGLSWCILRLKRQFCLVYRCVFQTRSSRFYCFFLFVCFFTFYFLSSSFFQHNLTELHMNLCIVIFTITQDNISKKPNTFYF